MARKKTLRSGYTTGTCAAAAAKAAAELLLSDGAKRTVQIVLPLGQRVTFKLKSKKMQGHAAWASVIKDAGDDPDVTHGAEVGARVGFSSRKGELCITGGAGVGRVTKPGLPVPPGHAAINPVPLKMIRQAVEQARRAAGRTEGLAVEIVVPQGEALARKTLNARLGILGGISILGTTGIVKPVSSEAWTATITTSMRVAEANGQRKIVLSSGRTSERVHMENFGLDPTAYIMMGDKVEWSLVESKKFAFEEIDLCALWAKMLKIAMATPDTHVRSGVLDLDKACRFLAALGVDLPRHEYHTARQIFESFNDRKQALKVCRAAGDYARKTAGIPVRAVLVTYDGEILT